MADTPPAAQHVPVGAMTAAVVAGIVAGGLGGKLLHDVYPTIAILLAPLLGLGLYVLVRRVANADGNPSVRGAVMLSATCFTAFYFFVLAGETWHPIRARDALVRLVQALTFLARMLGAAALPIVIAGVAAWHAAGEARRHVRPGAVAPLIVAIGLGAAAFTVSMSIFVASIAVLPRAVSPYVMVGVVLILPFVFYGVWTYVYGLVLSRWEVEMPESLVRALADLKSRCAFQFDRVICLDGSYGNGRLAAVTSTLRSTTLIISEPLAELLGGDELLAILAHETAHVELGHFRRKLRLGLLTSVVSLSLYVALSLALDQVVPRTLRLGQFMLLGMLFVFARQFYVTFVTRRHEREADEYAARSAGANALLSALEKLGAGRSPFRTANRWTTHSTWEIRSRRLREMAACELTGSRQRPATSHQLSVRP